MCVWLCVGVRVRKSEWACSIGASPPAVRDLHRLSFIWACRSWPHQPWGPSSPHTHTRTHTLCLSRSLTQLCTHPHYFLCVTHSFSLTSLPLTHLQLSNAADPSTSSRRRRSRHHTHSPKLTHPGSSRNKGGVAGEAIGENPGWCAGQMREGMKEERGERKKASFSPPLVQNRGRRGLGEANATTRCIYSPAGVWLKGSYSESAVSCVLSSN